LVQANSEFKSSHSAFAEKIPFSFLASELAFLSQCTKRAQWLELSALARTSCRLHVTFSSRLKRPARDTIFFWMIICHAIEGFRRLPKIADDRAHLAKFRVQHLWPPWDLGLMPI